MTYYDLTSHEKTRFRKNRNCSFCHKVITNEDDLIFTKARIGSYVKYTFYHGGCYYAYKKEQQEQKEKFSLEVTFKEVSC